VRGASADADIRENAADLVWVPVDPGLYHLLVNLRGWSRELFTAWLAASLVHELVGDG
jgi:hypothetical protein